MKYFPLLLLVFSASSFAVKVNDNNCKSPLSSTGVAMMDEMREKMHIDTKGIKEKDITTELLFNDAVTDILSEYYAKQSYEEDRELTLDAYKEMYSEDNPVNLIIKFTVKNSQKKENIFLISAIASDYECNIRFNGYVIVKREF